MFFQDAHSKEIFYVCGGFPLINTEKFLIVIPLCLSFMFTSRLYLREPTRSEVVSLSLSRVFMCANRWGAKEHQSMTI